MDSESRIRILPQDVVNKIAAGEVVERPASVLKELVENSLDAGATRIAIEISAGGRKLVAVRDNGHGMSKDDAILSIERHATSKIRTVHDIERISTLGFRGEALAAIASVSRFRLATSRRGDAVGTEIIVIGGKISDIREIASPGGTEVEVRDIFFNVPARRKFLRSYETELAHIRQTFIVQSLSHPEVGMTLKVDGREVHRLPEQESTEDRIRDIFGTEYMNGLRPVSFVAADINVSGYVSLPTFGRGDRAEQYFFINGRAASSPVLAHALREAYRRTMPSDRHPSVFLMLTIDPETVDVNVHPTKKEVRFRRPGEVRDAIIAAVSKAIGQPQPYLTSAHTRQSNAQPTQQPPGSGLLYPRSKTFTPFPTQPASKGVESTKQPDFAQKNEQIGQRPSEPQPESLQRTASPWQRCRIVGQIGDFYVVVETEDGFALMDPHAAHERVLYERYMADLASGRVITQGLLIPETIEAMPADAARLRNQMDIFRRLGFAISNFGGDSFIVDAVPAHFAGTDAKALILETSRELEESGAKAGAERLREDAAARAACSAAVKAREPLTIEEIERLLNDLAAARMPYTCPHGRPTLIFTSYKELARKFGREK